MTKYKEEPLDTIDTSQRSSLEENGSRRLTKSSRRGASPSRVKVTRTMQNASLPAEPNDSSVKRVNQGVSRSTKNRKESFRPGDTILNLVRATEKIIEDAAHEPSDKRSEDGIDMTLWESGHSSSSLDSLRASLDNAHLAEPNDNNVKTVNQGVSRSTMNRRGSFRPGVSILNLVRATEKIIEDAAHEPSDKGSEDGADMTMWESGFSASSFTSDELGIGSLRASLDGASLPHRTHIEEPLSSKRWESGLDDLLESGLSVVSDDGSYALSDDMSGDDVLGDLEAELANASLPEKKSVKNNVNNFTPTESKDNKKSIVTPLSPPTQRNSLQRDFSFIKQKSLFNLVNTLDMPEHPMDNTAEVRSHNGSLSIEPSQSESEASADDLGELESELNNASIDKWNPHELLQLDLEERGSKANCRDSGNEASGSRQFSFIRRSSLVNSFRTLEDCMNHKSTENMNQEISPSQSASEASADDLDELESELNNASIEKQNPHELLQLDLEERGSKANCQDSGNEASGSRRLQTFSFVNRKSLVNSFRTLEDFMDDDNTENMNQEISSPPSQSDEADLDPNDYLKDHERELKNASSLRTSTQTHSPLLESKIDSDTYKIANKLDKLSLRTKSNSINNDASSLRKKSFMDNVDKIIPTHSSQNKISSRRIESNKNSYLSENGEQISNHLQNKVNPHKLRTELEASGSESKDDDNNKGKVTSISPLSQRNSLQRRLSFIKQKSLFNLGNILDTFEYKMDDIAEAPSHSVSLNIESSQPESGASADDLDEFESELNNASIKHKLPTAAEHRSQLRNTSVTTKSIETGINESNSNKIHLQKQQNKLDESKFESEKVSRGVALEFPAHQQQLDILQERNMDLKHEIKAKRNKFKKLQDELNQMKVFSLNQTDIDYKKLISVFSYESYGKQSWILWLFGCLFLTILLSGCVPVINSISNPSNRMNSTMFESDYVIPSKPTTVELKYIKKALMEAKLIHAETQDIVKSLVDDQLVMDNLIKILRSGNKK